jgi:hypothetical protein
MTRPRGHGPRHLPAQRETDFTSVEGCKISPISIGMIPVNAPL